MRKIDVAMLMGVAAALSAAAPAPRSEANAPAKSSSAARTNWNTTVTRTQMGTHILGNPAAKIKLTEFVSYTCPHCAHFEEESSTPLRVDFVAKGQGSVEVRNFVRDPVDLTVAMLTNCGPATKFFLNHAAFMRSQDTWIAPLGNPSAAQRKRWSDGTFPQRMKAIAKDFGFYPIMATRGYTATQIDKCLADEGLAQRLAADTERAQRTLGVTGTPSFAIDGVVLAGTHSWGVLSPQLDVRLRSGG